MKIRSLANLLKTRGFANFVLTAGGAIALFALLSHLFRERPFTTSTPWTVNHTALAGLATLLFASLRLRPAPKTAVAVVCFSLTAVLYTAELLLDTAELVLPGSSSALGAATPFWGIDRASSETKKIIAAVAAGFGVKIDARGRFELLADLRKRRIDAVPAVMLAEILGGDGVERSGESINADDLMPLGGISSTLTVLCNESGQYVVYGSDEHGFRNPEGIWNSASADMAAVGQSLAQGYCVSDGKGFVDLLRTHYPVTLNLGMSGESSLLQLAAIKEYLPSYAPKIVLWFFSEGTDLDDLYDESTHPLLMRYMEPAFSQRLLTRQPDIDKVLRRFVSNTETRARETQSTARGSLFVERSLGILKLWNLRRKLDLAYGIGSDDAHVRSTLEQTALNLLSETLAQAQTVTSSWGGTLYFVYLPSWNRYRNGPRLPEQERKRILPLVNALGIPVIDVQPAFQAQSDPLSLFPFHRFGHYNETGNQIVADTVLTFLSAHARGLPLAVRPEDRKELRNGRGILRAASAEADKNVRAR